MLGARSQVAPARRGDVRAPTVQRARPKMALLWTLLRGGVHSHRRRLIFLSQPASAVHLLWSSRNRPERRPEVSGYGAKAGEWCLGGNDSSAMVELSNSAPGSCEAASVAVGGKVMGLRRERPGRGWHRLAIAPQHGRGRWCFLPPVS